MTVQLHFTPNAAFLNGAFEAASQAFFYASGTTTPVIVYLDSALTTVASQPVAADQSGKFPQLWTDGARQIKAVVSTSEGAAIDTFDPVFLLATSGAAADEISHAPITGNTATDVAAAIKNNTDRLEALGTITDDGKAILNNTTQQTKDQLGLDDLTEAEANNATSTVFGQVSGQRLRGAITTFDNDQHQVFEWTHSADVAEVTFAGLADFVSLDLTLEVGMSSADRVVVQVSADNGATWRTAGYIGGINDTVDGDAQTDGLRIARVDTTTEYGMVTIRQFNRASARTQMSGIGYSETSRAATTHAIYDTQEAHNALRISTVGAANISSGVITLHGFKR